MGKCPKCGAYNSFQEEVVSAPAKTQVRSMRGLSGRSRPQRIGEISGDAEERMAVPIEEFSRGLGGGIVPGSVVLISGDPGIGKSTLLLQMALEMARLSEAGSSTVLYVSGEESERQIKMRGTRLLRSSTRGESFPDDLYLVTETNLNMILEHIEEIKPQLLIVDSIQTTYIPEKDSSAGSVSQVRESASQLRELAKSSGISVFIIGHVTKEGAIAGPRVLEHIVDTVLYLEGDRYQSYRLLRSVKNRFG
ncbi:MAG: DNA repair protein RadA, partial [Candidatus Aminicenantes bacterium]|nr:DNA repair protein RadA [Candidatus Aminicenantes bacterium]